MTVSSDYFLMCDFFPFNQGGTFPGSPQRTSFHLVSVRTVSQACAEQLVARRVRSLPLSRRPGAGGCPLPEAFGRRASTRHDVVPLGGRKEGLAAGKLPTRSPAPAAHLLPPRNSLELVEQEVTSTCSLLGLSQKAEASWSGKQAPHKSKAADPWSPSL